MSSRCTCCHVCHTSLKTSRRSFYPCSTCPTIICRPCIELTNQVWEEVNKQSDWSCPRCKGDCPCKRCKNKVSHNSARKSTDKKLEKRNKRNRSLSIEDNAYSPPYKMHRNNSSCESSPNRSIVGEEDRDERQTTKLDDKHNNIYPEDEMDEKERRISELKNKNQQCLDYIRRTERLLALIRSEQDRISDELESIINRSNRQPVKNVIEDNSNSSRKKFAKVAEKLYPTPSPNDSFSDTSESSDSDEYEGYEFKPQDKIYVPSQFPMRSLMTQHESMQTNMPSANISNLISV